MGAREGVGEMKPVAAAAEKGDGQMQEEEAARLLANAVKYYRLASEAEGGGSRRGLFSMGWLHQVRVVKYWGKEGRDREHQFGFFSLYRNLFVEETGGFGCRISPAHQV